MWKYRLLGFIQSVILCSPIRNQPLSRFEEKDFWQLCPVDIWMNFRQEIVQLQIHRTTNFWRRIYRLVKRKTRNIPSALLLFSCHLVLKFLSSENGNDSHFDRLCLFCGTDLSPGFYFYLKNEWELFINSFNWRPLDKLFQNSKIEITISSTQKSVNFGNQKGQNGLIE